MDEYNYTYNYDYYYNYHDMVEKTPFLALVSPSPPKLTKTEIGLIHLILPLIFIPLQSIILIVFYRHSSTFQSMPYKIMKHQGQILLIQQFGHLCTSYIILFSIVQKSLFVAIIGSMINACYIGNVMFILLLTINRLLIMYNKHTLPVFVDKIFGFGIFLCYLCAIFYFILFMLPSYRVEFDLKYFEWYNSEYIDKGIGNQLYLVIQNRIVLVTLGIATILYLLIFLRIISLRLLSRNSIIIAEDAKFLLYAILNFVSIVFLELAWTQISIFYSSNEDLSIIPQILYIFVSGSNTIFTFCFVNQVRKNIFTLIKLRKETTTTKIQVIRY